jgi:hypothetical protein
VRVHVATQPAELGRGSHVPSGLEQDRAFSGSGDTLAVAEYDADRGKGALYVLARSGGTWSHQSRIQADNAENGDSLGYSMAISDDGNTIAAGAADEDCLIPGINVAGCDKDQPMDNSSGAAYVFVRNGTTWTQQAFIKSSNPAMPFICRPVGGTRYARWN